MYVVCREGNPELLNAQLATHALDVVITDTPAPPHVRVSVFNHPLGESDIAFLRPPTGEASPWPFFPAIALRAADAVPTPTRRSAAAWTNGSSRTASGRRSTGEFEDSALMKVVGQGTGVTFPAPDGDRADVCRFYGVRAIGRTYAVRERYYAISAERRLKHPGVLAITSAARDELFAERS